MLTITGIKECFEWLIQILLAVFYPPICPYCNSFMKPNRYACRDCTRKIPLSGFWSVAFGGYRCIAPFIYEGIFKDAVHRFKFGNKPQFARFLAEPMLYVVSRQYANIDLVTCVPLHEKNLKERGYNQSKLLAKRIAKRMGIPYLDALKKIKNNQLQHYQLKSERENNVKNVYIAINKENLYNKNILLCDDILTTGHTLGVCAEKLRECGAKKVFCVTVCIVIPDTGADIIYEVHE